MKKIEFVKYHSLEDYQFDVGFDLTEEEFKDVKSEKRNTLFEQSILYIKNVNGRLLILDGHSFYITTSNNDFDLESGYYVVDEDRYGDKDKYNHIILEEEDLGEGLYSLILDTDVCDNMIEQFRDYESKKRNEVNVSVWFGSDYTPEDWREDFKELSKDTIIEQLKDRHKTDIDKQIEDKIKDEEERKAKENEIDIVTNKINKRLDFEIETANSKISYVVANNTLTFYTKANTPTHRLTFSSFTYFKDKLGNSLYTVKRLTGNSQIQDYLSNNEISFKYEKYEDDGLGNGKFKTMVELDFENNRFNGFKVAKNKIRFLMNRAVEDKFDDKYKDKKTIELLNRLSGIKVDVLDMDKLEVASKFDFYISISLHDRETFKVKFMGVEKLVEWNILKENLTYGSSVSRYISKSKLLKFCKALEIPNDVIEQQIKKTKILHKLKGENQ